MDAAKAIAMASASPRSLVCHYNPSMVTAALVVSLLGSFTSTQLMSQARGARTLPGVVIWTALGCLIFGFCGTWCLHFLGMLSCEFDVPIGLDPTLTVLSAVVAVSFTFVSLSSNLIQQYRRRLGKKKGEYDRRPPIDMEPHLDSELELRRSSERLLRPSLERQNTPTRKFITGATIDGPQQLDGFSGTEALLADIGAARFASQRRRRLGRDNDPHDQMILPYHDTNQSDDDDDAHSEDAHSMAGSQTRLSLGNTSRLRTAGDSSRKSSSAYPHSFSPMDNTLYFTAQALLNGLTLINGAKGFVWSIALTNMHFMGVKALDIPGGFVSLNPMRVILCALISWCVCCVGVILMDGMQVNIKQQVLFSIVAATGVAAVHFSGMYACSFWSTETPSLTRGYPIELPIVIGSVAIITCMASTGLLAHSATIARDKLADVLYTRRRLWAAIAQKENAEAAAAARSEFIASASHEIRTPLHQLQGYADLLSKSELSEEDRRLLLAIQHATRSLTMITSNVLDWSRLENGEAVCRPVAVDIRDACEAVVHVLPNREDNTETELIVVVAPDVPPNMLVDETFLQRILMNLLSNSFKFTTSGYVLLVLRLDQHILKVTVEDTGSGIPKSFLPQLFEPYKQVQAKGAERGTGLGLSITKRLLQRMQGSISVESKYQQDLGVGAANSGSVFTLNVPIAFPEHYSCSLPLNFTKPIRVTIVHDGKHRAVEGITTAWTLYGAEVVHKRLITDVPSAPETIIWVDLGFLCKHREVSVTLLGQSKHVILVPYNDKALFNEIIGVTPPTNIVPIRKPLIWHRIVHTIIDTQQKRSAPDPHADIQATPKISTVDRSVRKGMQESVIRKRTVLLVEDNIVNQKLGAKMLAMLNYDVLLAEDGQEAIDVVMEHGQTIDAILMDQSMPRKDGITATREIRAMEAAGTISKKQTIIAVTAAAGPEAHAQFAEAGTDVFLPKPLSLAKLEQTLSQYFKG